MPSPAKLTKLAQQGHGFAVFPEARIFDAPGGKSLQHLLFGDYITPPKNSTGKAYLKWAGSQLQQYKDETWIKVRSRQEDGWMRLDDIQPDRVLEVNFVDIGQGDGCHLVTPTDEHFIIDAGEGDNMYRFLRWRFNLAKAGAALPVFNAVISHPDEDHFKGFMPLLATPPAGQQRQIRFSKVYTNGIIQRAGSVLGESKTINGIKYLTDFIDTPKKLKTLLDSEEKKSNYQKLLSGALTLSPNIVIQAAAKEMGKDNILYRDKKLKLEVLAPVVETPEGKKALRWFSDDVGKTKNGHSVVLMAHIGKIKILLGGDLNSKAADYLMSQYSGKDIELLKKQIAQAKPQDADHLNAELREVVNSCRAVFQAEIAKSCHHGSNDITNEFLQSINAIATVISSGDEESFCHPRPETLGAIGKYGRGDRPLIYSTELARSSPEFINIKDIRSDQKKQRVVATYGLITVRTDGERAILAQKLEKPRSSFGLITKWQIDKLIWNDERGEFISKK